MELLKKVLGALVLSSGLLSAHVSALSVYEDVGFVSSSTYKLGQFSLLEGAPVEVKLTDFGFNRNFDYLGVAITSASEEFLRLELHGQNSSSNLGTNIWGGSISAPLLSGGSALQDGIFRQTSGWVNLEAGNYYVALIASLDSPALFLSGSNPALYGVEVIATPLPASVWLFLSALMVVYRKVLVSKMMTFRHKSNFRFAL